MERKSVTGVVYCESRVKQAELAESLGWAVDDSRILEIGLTFSKGTKRVWPIRDGWQVADLIDGRYCNHNPVSNLEIALR